MKKKVSLLLALVLCLSLCATPALAGGGGFYVVQSQSGGTISYSGEGKGDDLFWLVTDVDVEDYHQKAYTEVTILSKISEEQIRNEVEDSVEFAEYMLDLDYKMTPEEFIKKYADVPVKKIGDNWASGLRTQICMHLLEKDYIVNVTIPPTVTDIGKAVTAVNLDGSPLDKTWMEHLTIHGAAGSYAETYAKEQGITFVADYKAEAEQPAVPETPAKPETPAAPVFADVPAWAEKSVSWAVEKGITNGMSDTEFQPSTECTDQMILTFIQRQQNGGVKDGDFAGAVAWAEGKKLVEAGAVDNKSECTRAKAVTYLWKLAGSPEAKLAEGQFKDVAVDADCAAAVAWAVENSITNGDGGADIFNPDGVCTRAQIVTFLQRYDENVIKPAA